MKKYLITSNRSLDGILKKLSSKGVKDGKVIAEIDDEDHSDFEVWILFRIEKIMHYLVPKNSIQQKEIKKSKWW